MDFPSGLLPNSLIWTSWVIYTLLTLFTLKKAPWRKLKEPDSLNIFLAAVTVLLIYWSINAGIYPGQKFHFLGACAVSLMFGWQFGWLAIQLVILVLTCYGKMGAESFALNALIMGGVPIAITVLLRHHALKKLPHNFFIYIFINSFFASSLGILLAGFSAYLVLSLTGAYPNDLLLGQYLPVYLLLSLPEGLLNGSAITLMVVYKPHWVATFQDHTYLYKRKP